jgi:hypothetical protein
MVEINSNNLKTTSLSGNDLNTFRRHYISLYFYIGKTFIKSLHKTLRPNASIIIPLIS